MRNRSHGTCTCSTKVETFSDCGSNRTSLCVQLCGSLWISLFTLLANRLLSRSSDRPGQSGRLSSERSCALQSEQLGDQQPGEHLVRLAGQLSAELVAGHGSQAGR